MSGTAAPTPSRESLAFRAIAAGNLAALKGHVEAGANIEAKNAMDETMLVYALQRGRDDIARYLLDNKADINARGRDKKSPLILALSKQFNDVAKKLLDLGADKSLKDTSGATAYSTAKLYRNETGLHLLYDKMTDLEAHVEALWAIREDDLPRLKYLVEERGVKLSTPGPDGQTLAHDMSLWQGGAVHDYVLQRASIETAAILGRGVGGDGADAPEKASFKKSRRRPTP